MKKLKLKNDPQAPQLNIHDRYLTSTQVRQRYGDLSEMSIWRWLRDPDMAFPRPLVLRRRRFWREADLVAWERQRAARSSDAA
jgi:predicted DNA-binding transcriptional regulator AlpA